MTVDDDDYNALCWLIKAILDQTTDYKLDDMEDRLMKIHSYAHVINKYLS